MAVKNAAVLVDRIADGTLAGRLLEDGGRPMSDFQDINIAALKLEQACSEDRSPFPSVRRRSFSGPGSPCMAGSVPRPDGRAGTRRTFMKEMQDSGPRGELGSFLICVQHRENGTWQGRVTWMEQNKTVNFRSVWEMVQLIDEAIRDGNTPEISWDPA